MNERGDNHQKIKSYSDHRKIANMFINDYECISQDEISNTVIQVDISKSIKTIVLDSLNQLRKLGFFNEFDFNENLIKDKIKKCKEYELNFNK